MHIVFRAVRVVEIDYVLDVFHIYRLQAVIRAIFERLAIEFEKQND